ncbi:hypothetical protein KAW64_10760 [bacterium]|nr:hypothetical protein [bacterium]
MTEHLNDDIIKNYDDARRTRRSGAFDSGGARRTWGIAAWIGVSLLLAAVFILGGCARKGDPVSVVNPDEPLGYRLVATFAVAGYGEGVDVVGDIGLMATGEVGLVILDMSDPEAPVYLGTAGNDFSSLKCAYAPGSAMAFVTDGPNGVLAYDVSDPTSPDWKTVLQSTSGQDVVISETDPGHLIHIYVADKNGGFRIWELNLDWGPPWFPIEVYHGYTTGYARGLCLHGDYVLVASGQSGLTIFELTNPGTATKLGTFDTPGNAQAVAAFGDYAFVADGLYGLQVMDISDPVNAETVASIETNDYATDVVYLDGMVYIADRYGGLRVVDVSDPLEPAAAGHLVTPYANGISVTDNYVYLADRDWGLVILEEE